MVSQLVLIMMQQLILDNSTIELIRAQEKLSRLLKEICLRPTHKSKCLLFVENPKMQLLVLEFEAGELIPKNADFHLAIFSIIYQIYLYP